MSYPFQRHIRPLPRRRSVKRRSGTETAAAPLASPETLYQLLHTAQAERHILPLPLLRRSLYPRVALSAPSAASAEPLPESLIARLRMSERVPTGLCISRWSTNHPIVHPVPVPPAGQETITSSQPTNVPLTPKEILQTPMADGGLSSCRRSLPSSTPSLLYLEEDLGDAHGGLCASRWAPCPPVAPQSLSMTHRPTDQCVPPSHVKSKQRSAPTVSSLLALRPANCAIPGRPNRYQCPAVGSESPGGSPLPVQDAVSPGDPWHPSTNDSIYVSCRFPIVPGGGAITLAPDGDSIDPHLIAPVLVNSRQTPVLHGGSCGTYWRTTPPVFRRANWKYKGYISSRTLRNHSHRDLERPLETPASHSPDSEACRAKQIMLCIIGWLFIIRFMYCTRKECGSSCYGHNITPHIAAIYVIFLLHCTHKASNTPGQRIHKMKGHSKCVYLMCLICCICGRENTQAHIPGSWVD